MHNALHKHSEPLTYTINTEERERKNLKTLRFDSEAGEITAIDDSDVCHRGTVELECYKKNLADDTPQCTEL